MGTKQPARVAPDGLPGNEQPARVATGRLLCELADWLTGCRRRTLWRTLPVSLTAVPCLCQSAGLSCPLARDGPIWRQPTTRLASVQRRHPIGRFPSSTDRHSRMDRSGTVAGQDTSATAPLGSPTPTRTDGRPPPIEGTHRPPTAPPTTPLATARATTRPLKRPYMGGLRGCREPARDTPGGECRCRPGDRTGEHHTPLLRRGVTIPRKHRRGIG